MLNQILKSMFGLDTTLSVLLVVCIIAAMAFEFINGFHDTANAVATVIYTNSLKPTVAVVWSGIWNFAGVYVGGIAVAMGIVNLLPLDALIDQNVYHSVAMVMAIIVTAVVWNLATWYFGIPCSSSHTLIGSIFGVGLAYMLLPGSEEIALNWGKIKDVGLSLFISPVVGFGLALAVMTLLKRVIKNKALMKDPDTTQKPPFTVRLLLILTCTTVSFSHGSNDGQKGVGLVMIILIGIIPLQFAINKNDSPVRMFEHVNKMEIILSKADTTKMDEDGHFIYGQVCKNIHSIKESVDSVKTFDSLPAKKLVAIRKAILSTTKKCETLAKLPRVFVETDREALNGEMKEIKSFTEYAPKWVLLLISLSLGIGTMVGWKRIVVTLGEKIGKTPLSYAQGVTAQAIATATIGLSTFFALPVSTTHILSSGIAGTMVAKKKKNLRAKTIRNIAIAWIITLPVTILISGALFLLLRVILS